MPQLTVALPDKRKIEVDLELSATFQQVKVQIERQAGVPPEKQRLLCGGKERKNGAETLEAAGVSGKTKLMVMLVPGYTMPPPPAAAAEGEAGDVAAAEAGPEAASSEPAAVELDGELPVPESAAAQDKPGLVHVRQGANRFHVRVPHGLAAATFGELADYLSNQMLPRGIPASELRILCRGKTAEPDDVLDPKGSSELTVMLLFREGFHVAADGANWLKEYQAELAVAEAQIERLGKRVEANFTDAEMSLRLGELGGLVSTLKQSVDSVRVSEAKLPEMREFRDRVLAADERLETIRKSFRF